MTFQFDHNNINVTDVDRAAAFYEKALGLKVLRRRESEDGSFILCFLGDGVTSHKLELTWLRDHEGPYELGENESHLCFVTDDMKAARELHEEMGCVCYVNEGMGIYFIEDPDGYWTEIVPKR